MSKEALYLWPDPDHNEPPRPYFINTAPEAWPGPDESVEDAPEGNFYRGAAWLLLLDGTLVGAIFVIVYLLTNL
jgi:hypothetical protein